VCRTELVNQGCIVCVDGAAPVPCVGRVFYCETNHAVEMSLYPLVSEHLGMFRRDVDIQTKAD